jgi:hypothetical protein
VGWKLLGRGGGVSVGVGAIVAVAGGGVTVGSGVGIAVGVVVTSPQAEVIVESSRKVRQSKSRREAILTFMGFPRLFNFSRKFILHQQRRATASVWLLKIKTRPVTEKLQAATSKS